MVVEDNPFVRFKNHIDNNIRRGWDVLVGSSAAWPTSSSSSPASSSPQPTGTTPTATTSNSTSSPSISPSSAPLSPYPKMPDSSSDKASIAATSDHQHTTTSTAPTSPTSPISPTSPTTPTTPTTPTPDPPETLPSDAEVTTTYGVHDWAVRSPYSPFNLQHLRQPTPNDAPQGCEGDFTFHDAFEDLLVTGSGGPLSMSRTPGWKKCLFPRDRKHRFGVFGEPRGDRINSINWVSGLGGQGLWDAYFDVRTRRGRPVYRDDWEDFRERAGMYTPAARVYVDGGDDNRRIGFGFGFGDRDRRSVWDDARRRKKHAEQGADFEDELYDAFAASFGEDKDMKIGFRAGIDENGKKDLRITTPGAGKEPEVKTITYPDGSKRVRTTERIETDGKEEVKTTECVYDKHGNLVSRSKGVARTRSWEGKLPGADAGASFSYSWNSTRDEANGEDDGDEASGSEGSGDRKEEKNGWFWKR